MSTKRKPARPQPAPGAPRPGPTPSPPVDFRGRPPMIVTLGEDLDESRRLAARLQELREAADG